MDQFDSLPSTPFDMGNPSMFWSCDVNEDFAAKPLCWNMSKVGFMRPLDEEFGVMEGCTDGLEDERDLLASVGFVGCEIKEMAGGMRISGACTYSNAREGSAAAAGKSSALQSALQKFLPSINDDDVPFWLTESVAEDVDFYSCDEFRIYEFKVRRCMRGRSHDWTECPFAHPGEKARRRDPRRFHYSGSACPDFRKGNCRKGDACEYAHGVFECWLHPSRYRTQLCKDGKCCTRKVCFFAHTPSQLRLFPATSTSSRPGLHSHPLKAFLSGSYDGSPLRQAMAGSVLDGMPGCDTPGNARLYDGSFDGCNPKNSHLGLLGKLALGGFCSASQMSSPTSTLVGHSHSPPPLSPPLSPSESPPMSPNSPCGWSHALAHRRIASLPGAQVLHRQAAFDPHVAVLQVQASLGQSNVPVAIGARGLSNLSSNSSINRRHLERHISMPTVSISTVARAGDHSLSSLSKELHSSQAQAMNQLMATLQQLELKHAAEESKGKGQWQSSPQQFSRCAPGSPNWSLAGQVRTWDAQVSGETPRQKVESGREIRAKIYGRLGKETPVENEIPDFGWVNELVK